MKKLVNILFATAVAAFALVSCQKNLQEENVSQKETVEAPAIHFYATDIATKTVFGDVVSKQYPTLWTTNKGIKISYNKKTSVEATVTPKDGDAKADFTPASEITDAGTGTNVFYALSPSTAQAANISGSYYSWRFTVPTSQTPLDASVDEDAQVLYAKYDAGATFPTAVPFSFRHLTAYGKLSFKGLALDGDETVTSITLTASENWVGEWYYYVDTKDPNTEGDIKPASASKKLTLNTDKVTDIWFACAPVDLSDGGTIDINVFTNKGVFVKKITFPAGKGDFAYGEIGAFMVDMSAVTRTTIVNSIAEIKALYTSSAVPFVANLTDALVTLDNSNNFYLEDASGAILGFTAGHGLSAGDKLNGTIQGTITKYQGNYEITDFINEATKTTGSEVTPYVVTADDLLDNFASYESKLVKVANVTISAVNNKNLNIEGSSLIVYNNPGIILPAGSVINAVGIATYYNTDKEVKIFSLADDDMISIVSQITASDKNVGVGGDIAIGATTNSPATITYVSGNTSIATVDDSGNIHGVAAGSTTITCSVAASGKYSAGSKVINVTVSGGAVYTLTFSSSTMGSSVSNYTSTWTNTCSEFDWTLTNFNNNQKGWNYVKCGRKNNASVGTITTSNVIPEAISTVKLTIDAITADKVNSIKLYVDTKADFSSAQIFTGTKTTGEQVFTITTPTENCYYKLEFDCASGSANGLVTVSKVIYSE